MSKRKTIKDVALAANVSVSTVDRILNRRAPVKFSTVEHVLNAADRIGFYGTPSIHSRLIEEARPATLGFLLNGAKRHLYHDLAQQLTSRTRDSRLIDGQALVTHLGSPNSAETAEAIDRLAARCDALAVVAVDTPAVNAAVTRAIDAGKPVFALLSYLSAPRLSGTIGADPDKLGQGAAWLMNLLLSNPGRVGLMPGARAYHAHRHYEAACGEALRTHGHEVVMMEESLECDIRAEAVVRAQMDQARPLDGIVVTGGGMAGAARALEKVVRSGGGRCALVGTETSSEIDAQMRADLIDASLSHAIPEVVARTVAAMEAVLLGSRIPERSTTLPIEIRTKVTI